MFKSIDFKEFCGVRTCKKPVKLHRFTVLIGPNNSGKTTLLSGLFLFPYAWTSLELPLLPYSKPLFLEKFLHRNIRSLVYRYSGNGQVSCVFQNKELRLEVYPNRIGDMWLKTDEGEKTIAQPRIDTLKRLFRDKKIMSYTILIPNSDFFREELEIALVDRWEDVEKTGAHIRLVRDLVSKVVEDKLTEVSLKRSELVVRKELPWDDVAHIELRHMGDGIKRFLTNALWLEAIKPKVVLWDDLEASAHPSLIKEVIEWLDSHNWQVVLSTHSIDVLHEIVLAEPKDSIVLALRKLPDDTLTYREYTLEELGRLFESGQDIRKLLL